MKQNNKEHGLKWWIMLIISILSAIAGGISENATDMIGRIF